MKLKLTGYLILCCMLSAFAVKAQRVPLLTLKDAIDTALQNNYNIKLAQNNATIAQNNVSLGNAGFLPSLTGSFTNNNSVQNSTVTRTTGTQSFTNVRSRNNNYGVAMDWTIFDGFAMFANYDALKTRERLSGITSRDTVLQTLTNVINTYYSLINQNQILKSLKGAIGISKAQLQFAKDKFAVGAVARLDVYNAEVNVNTDTANYLAQLQLFKTTKIQLNQLLVRNLQTDFAVTDTIVVDEKLALGDVLAAAAAQNPRILSAQIAKQLAEINLRQVRAVRYPVVGLTTGYNFTNSRSPSGALLANDARGLTYGLTASINIFDGFNQRRRENNAKIQVENSAIQAKNIKLGIDAQVNSLYTNYLSGLELIKLGQANVAIAKRNLEITLDKYKLGNITPLEVRQAEENFVNAQVNYYSAEYQAKSAEISLKQITNNINIQ
ncbi:TolC family protein [Mucilaginibacter auburnensis]|uniref:Outer membrane protein TolC n=1 Tax=Mucilaginibacter auburnensis TaxID=1457233 RepID=A0A2H9VPC6_9SPHI|nr:TolC family protein [Mucilaginibacter auburnensis]PJJ80161.1 outer membrane protein TolC [Mucilaginibacter auburnensis]